MKKILFILIFLLFTVSCSEKETPVVDKEQIFISEVVKNGKFQISIPFDNPDSYIDSILIDARIVMNWQTDIYGLYEIFRGDSIYLGDINEMTLRFKCKAYLWEGKATIHLTDTCSGNVMGVCERLN